MTTRKKYNKSKSYKLKKSNLKVRNTLKKKSIYGGLPPIKSEKRKTVSSSIKKSSITPQSSKVRTRLPNIPQVVIGVSSGSYSGYKNVSNDIVEQAIDEMKDGKISWGDKGLKGPYFISLTVEPERHQFLINIDESEHKLWIGDWGERTSDSVLHNDKTHDWGNYLHFKQYLLEQLPGFTVDYYPIDGELIQEAKKHNICSKGGGCSFYINKWVTKQQKEGRLFTEYAIQDR
jgi:hypothetical protein